MAFTFTIGLGRDLIPQLTTCTVLDLSYKDSRIPFKVAVYVLLTRFRAEVVSLFHRKNKWYTMFDVSGKLASDYESALKDPEWPKKLYKAECDAYKGNFFTNNKYKTYDLSYIKKSKHIDEKYHMCEIFERNC